jgi:hypothetical protein
MEMGTMREKCSFYVTHNEFSPPSAHPRRPKNSQYKMNNAIMVRRWRWTVLFISKDFSRRLAHPFLSQSWIIGHPVPGSDLLGEETVRLL